MKISLDTTAQSEKEYKITTNKCKLCNMRMERKNKTLMGNWHISGLVFIQFTSIQCFFKFIGQEGPFCHKSVISCDILFKSDPCFIFMDLSLHLFLLSLLFCTFRKFKTHSDFFSQNFWTETLN